MYPPIGVLVGEQSNAYRILLRYDRKSRHRRIKKQRRYERLAATSQFCMPHLRRGGIARTVAHGAVDLHLAERWSAEGPGASQSPLDCHGAFPEPDATPKDVPPTSSHREDETLRDNWSGPPIPVVTFLAPLASNFEGLKDR